MLVYHCFLSRHGTNHSQSHALVGFSLAIMIITFLPASNLFFLVGFVVAERVLFLPSMGFCILIAVGATKLINYFDRPFYQRAIKAAIVFLLFSYSIKTVKRNEKWLSGHSLYIEALKLNQHDGLMYSNLGYSFENTNPQLAEQAHKIAVQMSPNYSQPFRNYGALLMRQGRYAQAEQV